MYFKVPSVRQVMPWSIGNIYPVFPILLILVLNSLQHCFFGDVFCLFLSFKHHGNCWIKYIYVYSDLSKITADGGCSHEIKRRLLLGRKVMTNLHSILKSRDITLPTKVRLVKAMVFPVVMYGCDSWAIRKAECQRIGVSASASVLPMNMQDWSPLGWTGWISLQSKGL